MARLRFWILTLAVAVLALSTPDLASAQVKTGTTAGAVAPIVQKVIKKRARLVDPSIATCTMFGSNGKTIRPGVTHMTQGDHARIRAEHQMMSRATAQGNGDEAVYYEALTGDARANPKFNRLRIADRLGLKKGCLLSGTP
jgi:hypothetical protein